MLGKWFTRRREIWAQRGGKLASVPLQPAGPRANITVGDEYLKSLDLLAFNDGANPYGGTDNYILKSFEGDMAWFRETIRDRIGFTGGRRVLDLLCGIGRWSIFLAEVNDHVIGIERLPGCVKIGNALARELGVRNVDFLIGEDSLVRRFPDGHFDYVWMWSALQYVDRGRVLSEVRRILRPGGRVFVGNYNSTGIMIDHVLKGVRDNSINEGASQWALSALYKGPQADGCPNYADLPVIGAISQRHGFKLVAAGAEGQVDLRCRETGFLDLNVDPVRIEEHYFRTVEFIAEVPR